MRVVNHPAGLSVAQLVEHVTVDICDHRVAGSIPAAEIFMYTASLAQSVERRSDKAKVLGSSPSMTTTSTFWTR